MDVLDRGWPFSFLCRTRAEFLKGLTNTECDHNPFDLAKDPGGGGRIPGAQALVH
jgi:hypothetical protein